MGQWGEVHSKSNEVDENQCAIKISTGLRPRLLPRKTGRLSQIKKKSVYYVPNKRLDCDSHRDSGYWHSICGIPI